MRKRVKILGKLVTKKDIKVGQFPISENIIMQLSVESEIGRNQCLNNKYSSSQVYIFSKAITQLVQQKRTRSTIDYEDIQYYVDDDEYMRRNYVKAEYQSKISIFKQYYFYHEDCPRIFTPGVESIYNKWHDRKRSLVYKKLKNMFHDDQSRETIDRSQQEISGASHMLHDLSEYNPFSKKYYLRQQTQKKNSEENIIQKSNTINQMSGLKHQLSIMLQDINDLSAISTLDSKRIESKVKIYHRKSLAKTQSGSIENSKNSNSNQNSIIKFNFKKKAQQNGSIQTQTTKVSRGSSRFSNSKQKNFNEVENKNLMQINILKNKTSSPKQNQPRQLKSKSIINFASLGLNQQNNRLKSNSKRDFLKLSNQIKQINKKQDYLVQKSKQSYKMKQNQLQNFNKKNNNRYSSADKLKSNKLEQIETRKRQSSMGRIKAKQQQFGDNKMIKNQQVLKVSNCNYRSEHTDFNSKKSVLRIKQNELYSTNKKRLYIKD